ncbi:hypothetical protein DXG03_007768 [Asterophora parasitica]|uniref:Threonine/serine exporter-like N-terminal domain-containing protein n=1 Tax=Asterophora parasitica TaxID=117018 RepID=A0A9P7GC92_9AGAR|nr:hypothetical protein DXG03_007768 [Asterophora parasitica]
MKVHELNSGSFRVAWPSLRRFVLWSLEEVRRRREVQASPARVPITLKSTIIFKPGQWALSTSPSSRKPYMPPRPLSPSSENFSAGANSNAISSAAPSAQCSTSTPPRISEVQSAQFPIHSLSQQPEAEESDESRRGSTKSDTTIVNSTEGDIDDPPKLSYRRPSDAQPPQNAYTGSTVAPLQHRPNLSIMDHEAESQPSVVSQETLEPTVECALSCGPPSNILDSLEINSCNAPRDVESNVGEMEHGYMDSEANVDDDDKYSRRRMRCNDSMASMTSTGSMPLDPDDPLATGTAAKYLEDFETLRQMDYRTRRKHLTRVRIQFNVTTMANRQEFLVRLAKALMAFGAPSHRIESQLVSAARILQVEADFLHLPNVTICTFGDQGLGSSETRFIKSGGGRLSLESLHNVHQIYRSVVHDEISAERAVENLDALLKAPQTCSNLLHCFLGFSQAALMCPLAFGGSFLDMWIAGAGAFLLSVLELKVAAKSVFFANVFEIMIALLISFGARGLSSIRRQIFCYTAISSAGINSILPGYLILTSSLELASMNIVCGSVKMVYSLIYTLFLGFGLQIGSDFYLLLDRQRRADLDVLSGKLSAAISLTGSWLPDNATMNNTVPLVGTWTFVHDTAVDERDRWRCQLSGRSDKYGSCFEDVVDGCYRPESFPWYLQQLPSWTVYLTVPIYSTLSSLDNLQPFRSKELPVMVIISCAAYTSNYIANSYIFNRSDVVSAIGSFTVGLLGNIYSRKMGGTAFTSMVTGVLFLVPTGLSQAGGITAQGNGIDIGGAMIAVTIGITVGLFASQTLVYAFGNRKSAAVFSF